MKFFFRTTWLICFIALLCNACGQKGKLVMPVKPPPVSTPYPTAQPKDNDSNKDPELVKSDASAIEPAKDVPPDARPAEEKN
jgi:hypothetical protein